MSDRYRVEQCLGTGRTGSVHRATDTQTDRGVTLRRFDSGVDDDSMRSQRWRSEFFNVTGDLARIKHESVLPVLDAGIDDEGAYLVTGEAEGKRLSKLMPGQGKGLELKAIYQLAEQMLGVFEEAATYGFYHHVLGSSSVIGRKLESGDYQFTLMDLGHSRLIPLFHEDGARALVKNLDPALLAPELYEGKPQGVVSSLYMLGQMLYWVCAGGHPMAGLSIPTAHAKHKAGEMPYLRAYRSDLPENLRKWIYRLIEPDPAKRPQTVQRARELLPSMDEVQNVSPALAPKKMDWKDAIPDYG